MRNNFTLYILHFSFCMPTPSYTTTVTHKKLIAPAVYEFRCHKPAGFTYTAGQFVLIQTPLLSDPNDIQPRAYSIASAPSEEELLFVVKLKPGGRFSEFLEKKLDVGTEINMQGPFGMFTLRDGINDIILVATGSGIAPFRSHIVSTLEKNDQRTIHLLFGVRHEEDLYWVEEFLSLEKKHGNLQIHLCLSGENPGWNGKRGRVTEHIDACMKDPRTTHLYVCGSPEMVKDVKSKAIEMLKIPKANVHGEGYI